MCDLFMEPTILPLDVTFPENSGDGLHFGARVSQTELQVQAYERVTIKQGGEIQWSK